jgi:hypothetical protein
MRGEGNKLLVAKQPSGGGVTGNCLAGKAAKVVLWRIAQIIKRPTRKSIRRQLKSGKGAMG